MLLPPGQALHRGLSTSFTNFEELLLDLRENRFSGYIRLNFWGYEGILVLDSGKLIQAYSLEEDTLAIGEKAAFQILEKADEKEGVIDVHLLSNEVAITLASVLGATLYKEDPHLSGKKFPDIFRELEKADLTGYVDVQFAGNKGMATIYLLDGMPVESVIMSNTGRIASGEMVFEKILEVGRIIKSTVKIYRNREIRHLKEEQTFLIPHCDSVILEFWNFLITMLEKEVNRVLKKTDFMNLWQAARSEMAETYPCLDPISGHLKWKDEKISVNNIIPIPDFQEGLIQSLSLALQKMPARRRKKIKVGTIIDPLIEKFPESEFGNLLDPFKTVKRIFQGF